MEDMQARELSLRELQRLHRTISSDALWLIVMHKLLTGEGMSVMRTGDLDSLFLMRYAKMPPGPIPTDDDYFSESSLRYLGVLGIDRDEFRDRIMMLAKCDYLGMHISGYAMRSFDISPWLSHPRLVDNYFSNNWTQGMIGQLLRRARGVLMINRDESMGEQLARKVQGSAWVKMNDWRDAEAVCKQVCALPHQLVILSAGSAGKFIGIEIARHGKIVLDVGQSAWCFVA